MDPRLPRARVQDTLDDNGNVASLPPSDSSRHGAQFEAGPSRSSSATPSIARQVSALDVYEDAVQEPSLECSNLAGMYYQAQELGSQRPEARILREDFCSSAIVAQTWLQFDKANRAQGVDIDLDALKVAKRRMHRAQRAERRAAIYQSAAYSSTGKARFLPDDEEQEEQDRALYDDAQLQEPLKEPDHDVDHKAQLKATSTWAKGAASERFERKFQARLARLKLGKPEGVQERLVKAQATTSSLAKSEDPAEHLHLLHADVLNLEHEANAMAAPDLVYAGNYALSYFHDRRTLLAYLTQCRKTLQKKTGVLIVDPFAGPTGWEASSPAERKEQMELWKKFSGEEGFLRASDGADPPSTLSGHPLEFWKAPSHGHHGSADWRNWPQGRLVLVRKGTVRNPSVHRADSDDIEQYEYWREDGPLDYATNRFRMSLSFRFTRDNSWLRDYFSYDFRVWSLKEITEAMEEVGFARVAVHAIPRTTQADVDSSTLSSDGASSRDNSLDGAERPFANARASGARSDDDEDLGLDGMASLMRRTERHEQEKSTYQVLEEGEKLFATKSFGTYVIACMPSDGS